MKLIGVSVIIQFFWVLNFKALTVLTNLDNLFSTNFFIYFHILSLPCCFLFSSFLLVIYLSTFPPFLQQAKTQQQVAEKSIFLDIETKITNLFKAECSKQISNFILILRWNVDWLYVFLSTKVINKVNRKMFFYFVWNIFFSCDR